MTTFEMLTREYPYLMGFIKVGLLATLGELLAVRIARGKWALPVGIWMKAIIWGLLGMSFALMFPVFGGGVAAASAAGLLPQGGKLLTALLISTLMNICFAPVMMGFHRITDTFIDLAEGRMSQLGQVRLRDAVGHIDWYGFVSFVVLRTIPLFWIPAHTVTFLLPAEYRVLFSALLSVALGAILSLAKRSKAEAGHA
jgi:hypothetical protein